MSLRPESATSDMLSRSKAPAFFIALGIVVMVATVAWLNRKEEPIKPLGIEEVKGRSPVDRELDAARVEILDAERPFDPQAAEWGTIADAWPDGQREIPVAAFEKACQTALRASWGRLKLSKNVVHPGGTGFERLDVEAIMNSPAANRGLPVEVLGDLSDCRKIDLFDRYGFKLSDGRYEVWDGLLYARRDLHGSRVPIRFTLVDDVKDEIPAFGRPVKVQGLFFKLQSLDVDLKQVTGLWLIAKRIHLNYRVPAKDEIDLDLLTGVKDAWRAQDASVSLFADDTIFHLLAEATYGENAVRTEPIMLKGQQTHGLLQDPSHYRGAVIEFPARIVRIEHHPLESFFPQNAAGDNAIGEFWNTYVTADGATPITVMWTKKPPENLATRDQVRVRGIFYKLWAYQSAKGVVQAPLVIGLGDIEMLDVARADRRDAISWGIFGWVVLSIGLIAFVLWIDRRRSLLFQQTRRAKKQILRGSFDLDRAARQAAGEPAAAADAAEDENR